MRRACLIALLVLSCDPQADSDYPGEPLLTLSGQVKSDGPLPALEAAMLWQRGEPPAVDQQDLATRAPVQATFPATFTVHLYHPPPAPARRSLAPGELRSPAPPLVAPRTQGARPMGAPPRPTAASGSDRRRLLLVTESIPATGSSTSPPTRRKARSRLIGWALR